jgi:glycosyltransferase involved in cell wall biosynthesis
MEKVRNQENGMKETGAKDGYDILVFAGCDWWVHNPSTEKHWMNRLAARGHRVLFINSIGAGMPSLRTPRLFSRIMLKLKSAARWLRRPSPGVHVLTPVVLPMWNLKWVALLNVALLTVQIRSVMFMTGMRSPVFWSGLSTGAAMLDHIPHSHVVYYIQDNYVAYFDNLLFSRIQIDHDRMLEAADLIICAAIGMHDRISAKYSTSVYIPHGVASEFFSKDLEDRSVVPDSMRSIPHPIVGYWGSLEVLQDQELIRYLSEQHPEWSIVFIGKPHYDITGMQALPNVHFLGFVPLECIPGYGVHFDVAVINWLQTEWVLCTCPVKLREYLALGKPVVSVDIMECERAYPGAVRVTKTKEDFCRAVEEELANDTPGRRRGRRRMVEGESWDHAALRVDSELRKMFAEG